MNAIQWGIIEKLMLNDPDEWQEVTEPRIGDSVYVFELMDEWDTLEHSGVIENMTKPDGIYLITLNDGTSIQIGREDFEVEYDGSLPMWGTMWSFGDGADDWWLEEGDGIQLMSQCGFRIYEHEEFGYFFGIDGAGYDFYEAHWIPLYKARGLRWHDVETDEEDGDVQH
ncbi:MAG TPA: hypothetical protein O0W81_04655 [Methanocorpusculum sp.]|nr:hypothetical protein [Methanocorpusculum sp.]